MSELLRPDFNESQENKPNHEKTMDAVESLLGEETLESYGESIIVPEAVLEELEGVSIEDIFATVTGTEEKYKNGIDDVSAELFNVPGESYSAEILNQLRDIVNHYKIKIENLNEQFNLEAKQILEGKESLSTQELGEGVVRNLEDRKKAIERFVGKMEGDDNNAFTELTGLTPTDKIEFKHTPYTVEFYVADKDYENVRGTLTRDYEPEKDTSVGFYIDHTSKHGNLGLIVAKKEQRGLEKVISHERQHALRSLIEKDWKRRLGGFMRHVETEKEDLFRVLEVLEGDDKIFVANGILRTIKLAKVERTVKDEALAYFRMGVSSSFIEKQLTENPTYNKFPELKHVLIGDMERHGLSKNKAEFLFNLELEEGYRSEIERATSLMGSLLEKGLSRGEIVNFLTDKKFEDWPSLIEQS